MTFVFFILSYLDVSWVSVMGQSVFHWVLTTKIIHVYLEGDTVLLLDEKLPETAWIAHKGTVVTGMNHWWCSFWTVLQRGKVTWRGKRSMGKRVRPSEIRTHLPDDPTVLFCPTLQKWSRWHIWPSSSPQQNHCSGATSAVLLLSKTWSCHGMCKPSWECSSLGLLPLLVTLRVSLVCRGASALQEKQLSLIFGAAHSVFCGLHCSM